jgi:hypothetical protein
MLAKRVFASTARPSSSGPVGRILHSGPTSVTKHVSRPLHQADGQGISCFEKII